MTDFTAQWLDPADVAAWLRVNAQPPPEDTAALERVCALTELYAQRCRPDQWTQPDPDAVPPVESFYNPDAEVYHGAVMYAARETRRRNSPAGIETFADGGATFVAKYDADIERALRTGQWQPPGVG